MGLGVRASLVMVAVAWCPAEASAYVRTVTSSGTVLYWANRCISLTLGKGLPAELAPADARSGVEKALAAWSARVVPCSGISISLDQAPTPPSVARKDGVNSIVFRQGQWCGAAKCYDPAALAVTTVYFHDEPGRADDGVIYEVDIEVNGVYYRWGDLADDQDGGKESRQDVANVLTHEIGHLLGLEHNCYDSQSGGRPLDDLGQPVPDCLGARPDIREATMYPSADPGDTSKRTLSADDQKAICAIYPAKSGGASCKGSSSGCGACSHGARLETGQEAVVIGLGILILATRRRST